MHTLTATEVFLFSRTNKNPRNDEKFVFFIPICVELLQRNENPSDCVSATEGMNFRVNFTLSRCTSAAAISWPISMPDEFHFDGGKFLPSTQTKTSFSHPFSMKITTRSSTLILFRVFAILIFISAVRVGTTCYRSRRKSRRSRR